MISVFTFLLEGLSELMWRTPVFVRLSIGKVLGIIWFDVVRIRRAVALENLARAFPEKSEPERVRIGRANFQNYCHGFLEFLLIPRFSLARGDQIFEIEGRDNYDRAFARGQGLFILSLHLGSWEIMSSACEYFKVPLHVVTKALKAKGLNEVWMRIRAKRHLKIIAAEKTTFQILRAIRGGEVVGFVLDQFMGPPVGVRTRFFGHETGTMAALALFSDRTRAPVVPVYNVRLPNGKIRVIFEPEVPFMEQGSISKNIAWMTQTYTHKIEDIVRRYPEQWLWIHRRWKPFRE